MKTRGPSNVHVWALGPAAQEDPKRGIRMKIDGRKNTKERFFFWAVWRGEREVLRRVVCAQSGPRESKPTTITTKTTPTLPAMGSRLLGMVWVFGVRFFGSRKFGQNTRTLKFARIGCSGR